MVSLSADRPPEVVLAARVARQFYLDYPNLDFAGMTRLVDENTKLVAKLLNEWSAYGR